MPTIAAELTTTEAAKLIKRKRSRVIQLINAGRISARKFGRDWIVNRDSALAYRRFRPGPKVDGASGTQVSRASRKSI